MSPIVPVEHADETRDRILSAAEARFEYFGYRKTTMAEIADDVSMSAANLYRYFDSKRDIAAAFLSGRMLARFESLRAALSQYRSASDKLAGLFAETVHYTHQMAVEHPRVNEVVDEVTTHRPEVIHEKVRAIESLLVEIITLGNSAGEFHCKDVFEGARSVRAAMVLFEVPMFVGVMTREEYLSRADSLQRLLCAGLAAKNLD